MTNPYKNLPSAQFWKTAVSSLNMFDIKNLWSSKFSINKDHKFVTFGSCFAQHIGESLKKRGYNWLITEKPALTLNDIDQKLLGYNIFSARTGNIYTASLLYQWISWALKISDVPDETFMDNGKYYDPFRPTVIPNGFETVSDLISSRLETIHCFKESIQNADFFVFTLGLTESWLNKQGYEYPSCPGTVVGQYDESSHYFLNQDFNLIIDKLKNSIDLMKTINPKLKIILTVSPVPLTATNSGKHVLIATMQSKSILRAVAGQLSDEYSYIDYFPSYEIINSAVFKGVFFEPNQRNVNPHGVSFVMDHFFNGINFIKKEDSDLLPMDENCLESFLEFYSKN